jgi:hypothetical protein
MKMELSTGSALGYAIGKFGMVKLLGFGAALVGAGLMAIFRPPLTRKELFLQGAVALGCSLLLGGVFVSYLDSLFDWINLATAPIEEVIQFNVAVHGLLGALSWGIFGGLAVVRDRVSKDPVEVVKDVRGL